MKTVNIDIEGHNFTDNLIALFIICSKNQVICNKAQNLLISMSSHSLLKKY